MIVVGITGGIASGKSTASSILKKEYNAYVFDADEEAKLLLSNQEVSEKIIQSFPDLKSTDPKEMSKIVFKNQENQKKLNSIVHPALRSEMIKRIDRARNQKNILYLLVMRRLLLRAVLMSIIITLEHT